LRFKQLAAVLLIELVQHAGPLRPRHAGVLIPDRPFFFEILCGLLLSSDSAPGEMLKCDNLG
jgi:hypothetical protein